jgi:hypothetical protein
MNVEDLIGAVRATDGDDPELAVVTQLRVRRSLEARVRSRHQLAGLLTAAAILCGGTVSWALATGHVSALWAPAPSVIEDEPAPPRRAPAPKSVVPARPDAPVVTARASLVPPAVVPAPDPPAPPPAAIATSPTRAIAPVHLAPAHAPFEALYRHAHELHFHGGDPEATLAAWDAYLAAEPNGRFSVDARYNRALLLIRVGRYAEARAALAPFARGEVEPAGYRQGEAAQLVDRLARVNGQP